MALWILTTDARSSSSDLSLGGFVGCVAVGGAAAAAAAAAAAVFPGSVLAD